ncbi:hypothetical protein E2C01_060439 [Portunus trituberculatus]|uniref:Uncharacterized protein n=1 Tax=Portunus trituberculatus TaxID=210409 RepID=A0A5B7H592_PORTR|nr:hypothetical protein [Portunus trituberculatus]
MPEDPRHIESRLATLCTSCPMTVRWGLAHSSWQGTPRGGPRRVLSATVGAPRCSLSSMITVVRACCYHSNFVSRLYRERRGGVAALS